MPSKIPSSPHLCNWASWEERRRSANWTIVGGVVGPVWARQRDRTCCAVPTWYLSKSLPNSAIVQVLLFKLTYISKKHFNQIIIGRGSGLSSAARSHMLCRSDFEAANEPELVASCWSRKVNSESRASRVYWKWAWIYFLRFYEGRQLWSCLWTVTWQPHRNRSKSGSDIESKAGWVELVQKGGNWSRSNRLKTFLYLCWSCQGSWIEL